MSARKTHDLAVRTSSYTTLAEPIEGELDDTSRGQSGFGSTGK